MCVPKGRLKKDGVFQIPFSLAADTRRKGRLRLPRRPLPIPW